MQFIRIMLAFTRAGIGVMLQYRIEIILWSVWGIVNPLVLYMMMGAAAESNADQSIAGMDRRVLAAYYLAIMIVGHLTSAWDTYEMGHYIRTGLMSAKLLRPVMPIWDSLSGNLAYKITTLVFVVPMWCLFAWIVSPNFATRPWQLGLGLIALALGAILNFVFGYTLACIAFWSPKLDAIGEIYFGLLMYLGGRFVPIAALPPLIRYIADVLPFRWMSAFPAELLIGRVTNMPEAVNGLLLQVFWLGVILIAFRLMWSAAIRHYSAVSG